MKVENERSGGIQRITHTICLLLPSNATNQHAFCQFASKGGAREAVRSSQCTVVSSHLPKAPPLRGQKPPMPTPLESLASESLDSDTPALLTSVQATNPRFHSPSLRGRQFVNTVSQHVSVL